MADFGGLQDYTTADGRTLRLPPGLAASFGSNLTAVPPPQQPQAMPSIPIPPPDAAGSAPPPEPVIPMPLAPPPPVGAAPGPGLPPPVPVIESPMPPAPPTAAPVTENAPLGEIGTPTRAPAPSAGAPSSSAPTMAARPITADELRKTGASGVFDAQRGALEQAREAGTLQAEADVARSREQADAYASHMERQDAIDKKRAADAQMRLQQIAQRSADLDAQIDKYANAKIDTRVQHPILAGIAVALGFIGSAIDGGENRALTTLQKQIDANVNRQLAERKIKGEALQMKRGQIDSLRQQFTDAGALHDAATAAEAARFKTMLGQVASRVTDKEQKAKILGLGAGIDAKIAEARGAAVDKEQSAWEREQQRKEAAAQHRAQLGLGYAQLNRATINDDRNYGLAREQLALAKQKEANDREIALAKSAGKNSEEYQKLSKETEERGVRDPTTGDYLVNPKGRAMMAEADRLDAEAKALREAGGGVSGQMKSLRAQQSEEKAAILRDEARTVHAVRGRSPAEAAKADTEIRAAQRMLSLIDGIKNKASRAGTKVLNQSELQSALETEMSVLGLEIKDLYTLGSLDEGATVYMNKVTGGDPSKLTTAGFMGALGIGADNPEKTASKLEALAGAVEKRGIGTLTSLGVKPGEFKFARNDEAARPEFKAKTELLGEKTPIERAKGVGAANPTVDVGNVGASANAAVKGAQTLFYGETDSGRDIEQDTSKKYPGLSPKQEAPMDALLKQARGTGDAAVKAQQQLITAASETAATRPEFSNAVLNALRGQDPALYERAVAALPDEARELRQAPLEAPSSRTGGSAFSAEVGSMTPDTLARLAASGNDSAKRELFSRAASGDPDARRAWAKTLPRLQPKAAR